MRVRFVYDEGNSDGTVGGAELTMREFAAAAPDGVEITDTDPEVVVVGNCVRQDPGLIHELRGRRVIRYHHDLARYERRELREWLEQNATHVFCSPLHQDRYGLEGNWPNIPPALDLDAFRGNGNGEGACSVGAWQNWGKGQHLLAEWSEDREPVDVYGGGPLVPSGGRLRVKGPLSPEQVPETLHLYERFVFLPTAVEPFGRSVVEAWAAGLKLSVNANVGALHYLKDSDKLESAASDFWDLVAS